MKSHSSDNKVQRAMKYFNLAVKAGINHRAEKTTATPHSLELANIESSPETKLAPQDSLVRARTDYKSFVKRLNSFPKIKKLDEKTNLDSVNVNEPLSWTLIPDDIENILSQKNEGSHLIILISDRNPLFHSENLKNIILWAICSGFKGIDLVPTGTLQTFSIAFDLELKSSTKKVEKDILEKAQKEGLKTEKTMENKVINSILKAINEGDNLNLGLPKINIRRYKAKNKEAKHEPFTSKKSRELAKELETLEKLHQEGQIQTDSSNPFSIKRPSGNRNFYCLPQINSHHKHTRDLVAKIQEKITLHAMSNIQKVDMTAKLKKTTFYESLINRTAHSTNIHLSVIPWQSMIDNDDSLVDYKKEKNNLEEQIKRENINAAEHESSMSTDTETYISFALLLKKISDERFINYNAKSNYPLPEMNECDNPAAINYIRQYLMTEIPFFMMIIDAAIKAYKNHKVRTYLAYPMSADASQVNIFKYIKQLTRNRLIAANANEAFRWINVREIMPDDNRLEINSAAIISARSDSLKTPSTRSQHDSESRTSTPQSRDINSPSLRMLTPERQGSTDRYSTPPHARARRITVASTISLTPVTGTRRISAYSPSETHPHSLGESINRLHNTSPSLASTTSGSASTGSMEVSAGFENAPLDAENEELPASHPVFNPVKKALSFDSFKAAAPGSAHLTFFSNLHFNEQETLSRTAEPSGNSFTYPLSQAAFDSINESDEGSPSSYSSKFTPLQTRGMFTPLQTEGMLELNDAEPYFTDKAEKLSLPTQNFK